MTALALDTPHAPEGFPWRQLPLLLLLAFLAACATTRQRPASIPESGVKIGKPYEVFGKTYVPYDDRSYDKRGIASWYGPNFHAKRTANGEVYDQNAVTAAHKTLPMPSWVEVTNRDNGRKLVVRINDRGPFVDGRIIDLSRRSAELLGVDQVGLANVRVRRVYPKGDWALTTPGPTGRTAAEMASANTPPPAVAPSPPLPSPPLPAPPPPVAPPAPLVAPVAPVMPAYVPPSSPTPAPASFGGRYIQIAALSDVGRAEALASVMGDFGPANVTAAPGGLWRVRVGPVADNNAPALLAQIRNAGYAEAQLVR